MFQHSEGRDIQTRRRGSGGGVVMEVHKLVESSRHKVNITASSLSDILEYSYLARDLEHGGNVVARTWSQAGGHLG